MKKSTFKNITEPYIFKVWDHEKTEKSPAVKGKNEQENPLDVITHILDTEYERLKPSEQEIKEKNKKKLIDTLIEIVKFLIVVSSWTSICGLFLWLPEILTNLPSFFNWFLTMLIFLCSLPVPLIVQNALYKRD